MKVVLLQDVAKVGRKDEVKNVADGYALNYLIPNKLAETATAKSLERVELAKVQAEAEKKIRTDLLLKNFGDLKGVSIEMERPASDQGHLFAGIHAGEIAKAVKEQTRLDIDPEYINLREHLKTVGEHEIEVKVGDRAIKFNIIVKGKPAEHHREENKK